MLATTPYRIDLKLVSMYIYTIFLEQRTGTLRNPSLLLDAPVRTSTMDHHSQHSGMRDSPSQMPASHVKYHLPYFTPDEVERMSERQRGKLSMTQEERQRQQACGFIEAVGSKIGLCVFINDLGVSYVE